MNENFDYKEVPQGYIHCLNTGCTRSQDCLRAKVGQLADKSVHYFYTVNPAYIAGEEECSYFQPDSLTRYASGITNLYADLPYNKVAAIKKILHDHFGHSAYYRIYNKKRLLSPEEQAFIHETFSKEGIGAEPQYDEYVEHYNFFSS